MADAADTTPLAAELERRQDAPETRNVLDLLERMTPELAKVLPDNIGPERFARIVTTELRRTPRLLECSPESLLGAMMLAAQLGLEPGPLGHVYFVPFKREVTFVVGYRGFVDLAYRSGLLRAISAATVRDGDTFTFRYGTRPLLDHTPAGPPGEREPIAYYAAADLKGGGRPFVVVYPEDVEKAKARSAAGRNNEGPWVTDFDAMARKTAVRRLAPLLPQSPVLARAAERDETPVPDLGDVSDPLPGNGR
jgi:recombination protein RecT